MGCIAKALGDIARAKGMSQVARDAGLSRESLYKALSGERSPAFDTILKVIGALGLKLHAEAVHVDSSIVQKNIHRPCLHPALRGLPKLARVTEFAEILFF